MKSDNFRANALVLNCKPIFPFFINKRAQWYWDMYVCVFSDILFCDHNIHGQEISSKLSTEITLTRIRSLPGNMTAPRISSAIIHPTLQMSTVTKAKQSNVILLVSVNEHNSLKFVDLINLKMHSTSTVLRTFTIVCVTHAQNDLWGPVVPGDDVRRHHESCALCPGQTKVKDLQCAVRLYNDIAWL